MYKLYRYRQIYSVTFKVQETLVSLQRRLQKITRSVIQICSWIVLTSLSSFAFRPSRERSIAPGRRRVFLFRERCTTHIENFIFYHGGVASIFARNHGRCLFRSEAFERLFHATAWIRLSIVDKCTRPFAGGDECSRSQVLNRSSFFEVASPFFSRLIRSVKELTQSRARLDTTRYSSTTPTKAGPAATWFANSFLAPRLNSCLRHLRPRNYGQITVTFQTIHCVYKQENLCYQRAVVKRTVYRRTG